MSDPSIVPFSHKDVVTALIKQKDIHEGIWGLIIEFGLGATNINKGPGDPDVFPAAIIPVLKIGIQSVPTLNSLSVNAAEVNPIQKVGNTKK